MNEIFDRLLIRIILVGIVCLVLFVYKYAHILFYPTMKQQMTKRFYPAENPADTIHLFSRLVGFTIILSSLGFDESHGIFLSIFHFFVWGTLTCALYLLSLFIVESIVLYNFEYKDEILKRQNLSYAIVCMAHAFSIAHVTRAVVDQSENSLVILFVLWLLSMVVLGFGSKYYSFLSKLNFNRLVTQQKASIAFSYAGFTLGMSWLVSESFDQEHYDITMYCVQVLLKMLLALIIFPLFKRGLEEVFKTRVQATGPDSQPLEANLQNWGFGFYECTLFLAAAILTSMIVNHIQFGTIYPFF
ncbi:MAG: hypothetical protein K2P81_13420 [Bacteriovoracaceae bacterium]|nr:hypothetical protein [Bacteriovoracaceae bacterium]